MFKEVMIAKYLTIFKYVLNNYLNNEQYLTECQAYDITVNTVFLIALLLLLLLWLCFLLDFNYFSIGGKWKKAYKECNLFFNIKKPI